MNRWCEEGEVTVNTSHKLINIYDEKAGFIKVLHFSKIHKYVVTLKYFLNVSS